MRNEKNFIIEAVDGTTSRVKSMIDDSEFCQIIKLRGTTMTMDGNLDVTFEYEDINPSVVKSSITMPLYAAVRFMEAMRINTILDGEEHSKIYEEKK
jgi:hypothetical protein